MPSTQLPTLECESSVTPGTDEFSGLHWLELSPRSLPRLQVWQADQVRLPDLLRTALEPDLREPAQSHTGAPGDGVIVLTGSHGEAANVLRLLRSHPLSRLRPILVVGAADSVLADATTQPAASFILPAVGRLSACLLKLEQLPPPDTRTAPERAELDLIRFIHTRDLERLEPVADTRAPIGFRYPIAEALLGLPTQPALAVLEELCASALLNRHLEERLHLCSSCGSSRLILREVCPECQSPSLRSEAALHHFPCAHVASEKTFRQNEELVCPKCHKQLRHIGVDYDRPQDELVCDACSGRCVEGVAGARCLECNTRMPAERTQLLELATFTPTSQLPVAAAQNWSPLSTPTDMLASALNTVDSAGYELLLEHTRAVCHRYGRPASVITISLKGFGQALDAVGRAGVCQLLKCMAAELRDKLRSTDAVTVQDQRIKILLTETDTPGCELVLDQLSARLGQACGDELELEYSGAPLIGDPEDG